MIQVIHSSQDRTESSDITEDSAVSSNTELESECDVWRSEVLPLTPPSPSAVTPERVSSEVLGEDGPVGAAGHLPE